MGRTQDLAAMAAENDEKSQLEERARQRHLRRVRNQVIVYMTVAVLLICAGVGAYLGGVRLVGVIGERRAAAELAAEAEAAEQIAPEEESTEDIAEAEAVTVESPAQAEEEQEEVPEKSDEELLDEMVASLIADMPLKDRVAGLFLVTPELLTGVDVAIKAGDGTQEALQDIAVGGLIYSAKNIKSEEQISEMLSKTSEMSKYPLFLATTELGGAGGELTKALSLEGVPSAAEIAESGDAAAAVTAGETIAKRLVEAGFTVDLALRANLTADGMSEAERESSFGSDPASAATLLAGEISSLEQNGINTAVGVFPTIADETDGNIPKSNATPVELEEGDYIMFNAAVNAGSDIIVVGNLAAPEIAGDNTPCSMSSAVVTEQLRNALGFDGIIMTDSMSDSVITDYYTADQAAVAAIKAGADMICNPEDLKTALDGVLDAVNSGVISEDRINESLTRIYRVKYSK